MNQKLNNNLKSLSFLSLGYKFLYLVENSLDQTILQGNSHIVISSKPTTSKEYHEKTKWSDFNIIIPILFNFYHGLELVMKGILLLDHEIKCKHDLFYLLEEIKKKNIPTEIIEILETYINIEKVHPILKIFLDDNDIKINELYEFLRYPFNKKFEKNINYFNLKYKQGSGISYFQEIIHNSQKLRLLVGSFIK